MLIKIIILFVQGVVNDGCWPYLYDMFMLIRKQHTANKPDASYIFFSEPLSHVIYLYWKKQIFFGEVFTTESELCYKMHVKYTSGFVVIHSFPYRMWWIDIMQVIRKGLSMSKRFILKIYERIKVLINNDK